MHILCYIPAITIGKGGAERVAVEMVAEMIRRQHQITFVGCAIGGATKPKYPLPPEVKFVLLEKRCFLADYITRAKPDVLFLFTSGGSLQWLFSLLRFVNIPTVVQELSSPRRILRLWSERRKLTLEQASILRQAFMSFFTHIRLTRPEYDESLTEHLRPDVFAFCNAIRSARCLVDLDPPGHKTIINVGGLKPHKNIFPLLEAFSGLVHDFPNWNLVICGEGAMRGKVEAFLARHCLQGRVALLGDVDDMYSVYARCQLSVITSLEEGNPLAVCESMVHGIPSVGYADCTGTNRLIKDNKNGLLVNAQARVAHLRECMRKLMANVEMRRCFGRQAYLDSRVFEPSLVYDCWEEMFISASAYIGNAGRKHLERRSNAVQLEPLFQILRTRPELIHDSHFFSCVMRALPQERVSLGLQ